MELNPQGTDYVPSLGSDVNEDPFQSNWDVLHGVLDDAPQKLTRLDILSEWPDDFDKPNPATLAKWLNRALDRSLIAREGTGRKSDPFRFWLPDREQVWKQDPFYEMAEQLRQDQNLPFESLTQRKQTLPQDVSADDEPDDT
jgi:hypothetical protein